MHFPDNQTQLCLLGKTALRTSNCVTNFPDYRYVCLEILQNTQLQNIFSHLAGSHFSIVRVTLFFRRLDFTNRSHGRTIFACKI